jgi:hypothetical protein
MYTVIFKKLLIKIKKKIMQKGYTRLHTSGMDWVLKGTVPPDFSPLVAKQLLLAPVGKPRNDFDFFRMFAEIFDFSGASPVPMIPAKLMILLYLDDSFKL